MDGTQVVIGDFPDILGVISGYYEGVAGVDGINVRKRQNFFIFINLGAGYIPFYDFTKNTIFHVKSPLGNIIWLEVV